MFKTIEHIETVDNTKSTTGIEIIIMLEEDQRWRVHPGTNIVCR